MLQGYKLNIETHNYEPIDSEKIRKYKVPVCFNYAGPRY